MTRRSASVSPVLSRPPSGGQPLLPVANKKALVRDCPEHARVAPILVMITRLLARQAAAEVLERVPARDGLR